MTQKLGQKSKIRPR